MRTTSRRILTGAAMVFALPSAWSQMHVAPLRQVAVELDSGHLGNSGTEEQVVFSRILEAPDAHSVQVLFEAIQLQESSYVRLRSLEDRSTQILRRETLEANVMESVTFRGSRLEIELVAAPGTVHNFLVIRTLLAGEIPVEEELEITKPKDDPRRFIVCSVVDGRLPNKDAAGHDLDAAVGRLNSTFRNAAGALVRGGCTASIVGCEEFDQPDAKVLLTAHHCFNNPTRTFVSASLEFDPPLSTATCATQPATAAKTFSVITQTIRSGVTPAAAGGPFDGATTDWAVFRTLRNSTTKRTPFEEQGAYYKTDRGGAAFNPTTITGFGADGGDPNAAVRAARHCANCSPTNAFGQSARHRTQQTHTGPTYTLYLNNNVFYGTHSCGGNSGSLLLQPRMADGQLQMRAVGVHTGGVRCGVVSGADVPANRGTNIVHAPFRNRIDEVCNMCDANNDKRVDNTDLADIRNALGLTAAGRQRMNPDNDAQVTVNDLRLCSLMCTSANCQ